MPPEPKWRSNLYLPSQNPRCLPERSFSHCQRVSSPASTKPLPIVSEVQGCSGVALARTSLVIRLNWSSATSPLRTTASKKASVVSCEAAVAVPVDFGLEKAADDMEP